MPDLDGLMMIVFQTRNSAKLLIEASIRLKKS
jgi:hypothetical protein